MEPFYITIKIKLIQSAKYTTTAEQAYDKNFKILNYIIIQRLSSGNSIIIYIANLIK